MRLNLFSILNSLIVILIIMTFTIFIFSFVSSNVRGATCINSKFSKTSYLPYETVQVEIDADVSQDIKENDIFLIREQTILPTKFFISKISASKYFVWFDLPSTSGNYTLKIRGNCKDGKIYVSSDLIKVDSTIASHYDELKNLVKKNFSSLSLEEHLLSAMALIDDEISEEALASYVIRKDSCLNKNCSTKLNALTLMAFKDSLLRKKMQDFVEASQNYVKKGSWKLEVNSSIAQECLLLINNEVSSINLTAGINEFNFSENIENITAKKVSIKLNCNNPVNSKLIYSYKQFSKEFNSTDSQFLLNNNGCFVTEFDKVFNDCDNEATSYALLALSKTNNFNFELHNQAVSWLSNNSKTIIDKAVIYYITNDSSVLSELLASQTTTGWWPKTITEYQPDIEASSITIFSLKNSLMKETNINEVNNSEILVSSVIEKEAIEKGEKWLLEKIKISSLKEKATILTFAFSLKDVEPLLEFWPGIIKTESLGSFDLILQNKGNNEITIDADLLNSTLTLEINPKTMKNLKFNIPLITTLDGRTLLETLTLNYHTKISNKIFSYNIPVLIFTQKSGEEQINGSLNTSLEEINQSKQQEIINETKLNRTAELNQSLLQLFRFVGRNISENIEADESFTKTISLSNRLNKEINEITLSYSSSLILMGGFIRIEPSFIENLAPGETKTITIYFSPSNSGSYSGSIIAKGKYEGQEIETSLPVTINVIPLPKEEKNCSELGGKICEKNEVCETNYTKTKDSNFCCIPAESCKKKVAKGQTTAIIIVVIIIVILIIVLILLRKKPKKEMKEFLKETSKQYEKKFQRPPSISRQL